MKVNLAYDVSFAVLLAFFFSFSKVNVVWHKVSHIMYLVRIELTISEKVYKSKLPHGEKNIYVNLCVQFIHRHVSTHKYIHKYIVSFSIRI